MTECKFSRHGITCDTPRKISRNTCLSCILGTIERVSISLVNELANVNMPFEQAVYISKIFELLKIEIRATVKWFEEYEPEFTKELYKRHEEEQKMIKKKIDKLKRRFYGKGNYRI